MEHDHNSVIFETNTEWAERAEYWLTMQRDLPASRKRRQRNTHPLVLTGHGVSLRVEGGALIIKDGLTHYPQERKVHRLFRGDLALPPRIIVLDGSGTLSFDVLSWLAEQGIPLARVRWNGEVAAIVGGAGCFDSSKIDWQRATRNDPSRRLAFAADLIRRKLTVSKDTLERHFEVSRARDVALAKADAGIERLRTRTLNDLNDVFAIEGECASAYFAAWNGLPISWTGTARKPVPEAWQSYSGRSSLATGVKAENRNASHPMNAMLNYGYAVKAAHVQIDSISTGHDPMRGVMHNGRKGSPGWVLDIIEPERPIVDGAVLKIIQERALAAADFTIRRDGVCRLSPQLARVVAAAVSFGKTCDRKSELPGRKPARFKPLR